MMLAAAIVLVAAVLVAIVIWVAHLERMEIGAHWNPDNLGWQDARKATGGGEDDAES